MDSKTWDRLITTAKEVTLENNGHIPQLMVYGSEHNTVMAFADFPNDYDIKLKVMLGAGNKLAEMQLEGKTIGELEDVVFISEAWMATVAKDEKPILPVRNNPDKIEVLIVVNKNIATNEIKMEVMDIIRDKKTDKIIEVEPRTHKKLTKKEPKGKLDAKHALIDAFIFAYKFTTERIAKVS